MSDLKKANQALRRGDFEEAKKLYEKIRSSNDSLAKIVEANIQLASKRTARQLPISAVRVRSSEAVLPAQVANAPLKEMPCLVDIVVTVYNALDDVKICVDSLVAAFTLCRFRIILVNDGSNSETGEYLAALVSLKQPDHIQIELLEHSENLGYTKAVNTGLKHSTAPYVVTLNSDTIVTDGWLEGLIRCMNSAPDIGICGPLSNAASWQNVPELYGPDGTFAINLLPPGVAPNTMARIVSRSSARVYPRTTFVNGFCFIIRRAVIDAVGYMDEDSFPIGYGEENDYCIRAQDAGFALALADDVYVFHSKSKSFGSSRRAELSTAGSLNLRKKHGEDKYRKLLAQVKRTTEMDSVRERINGFLVKDSPSVSICEWEVLKNMSLLFVLPVSGGSGGAHSVVQEAMAMRQMGIEAKVAVRSGNHSSFLEQYEDVPRGSDIFIPFEDEYFPSIAAHYDIVVATIFFSVPLVRSVVEVCPWILPAYYIQDYEPLFFERTKPEWRQAYDSYNLVPDMVCFAKTDWIRGTVGRYHGVKVEKVSPSIDHDVYSPDFKADHSLGKVHIAAMIRPQTPRRGAGRTMSLLKSIYEKYRDRVAISIFGVEAEHKEFANLERDFPFENLGIIRRPDVASLLARSDIFVDLSDYQAFGRTGLEAMASGAVAVVPRAGGAEEYAIDGENSIVADSLDISGCFAAIDRLLSCSEKLSSMRLAALKTANQFSTRSAAVSELTVLAGHLQRRRQFRVTPERKNLWLLPSRAKGGEIAGSGYVRLVAPYTQGTLLSDYKVKIAPDSFLPPVETADIVLIQRDLPANEWNKFDQWAKQAKAKGVRIVYEIDDDLLDSQGLLNRGYDVCPAALGKRVKAYLRTADLVTVSTHRLAELFKEYQRKVVVVPNFLDMRYWRHVVDKTQHRRQSRSEDGSIRLGYFGTPTHYADLSIVTQAIKKLQEMEGIRVEVEVIGAFQRDKVLFGRRVGLPKLSTYPNFVKWLSNAVDWDIGIIPLKPDRFNSAKSHLKFLEYAAAGLAIVCSDNPEYRHVARHEHNCLMVENTTSAWLGALLRLIQDPLLRKRIAHQALLDVLSHSTVQVNHNIYSKILTSAG